MNHFDSSIITFLNGFAHRSWAFDTFMYLLSDNALLKGGLIVALIWWAWFRPGTNTRENREYLLCGIAACLLAVFVARSLANLLPFHERPMSIAALHFQPPYGRSDENLINWSAFPSDHAAVFFALATSIFLAWRTAGLLALAHVFLFICTPRIYVGYHAPTDILAGAAIGIGMASLALLKPARAWIGRLTFPWLEYSPGSFYACFFILTLQIVTLFQSMRSIAHFLYLLVRLH
jgi:undecaprenyl-diphosphatase